MHETARTPTPAMSGAPSSGTRDLLVCPYTPTLDSGRALRTYGIVRALCTHREVDVLYVVFGPGRPDPRYTQLTGLRLHPVRPSRGPRRASAYLRARLAHVPPGFARGISPELSRAATTLATDNSRGRVIADGPVAAAALRVLATRRPVIYNAHNLESAFRPALATERRDLGSEHALERFERDLLETFAETWMASQREIELAHALSPGARLRYVPNVVDVAAISPIERPRGERRALFVADFAYEPNRNALRFLLEQVMPRVWAQLADARLAVVGRGLERPRELDPRVELIGFVADLGRSYASADCVVVALLEGGGSPLKFIEALAYGVPVLATPAATAGIEGEAGVHYLEEPDADGFARALTEVLSHGAPEIAAAGRQLAAERYSVEALSGLIVA